MHTLEKVTAFVTRSGENGPEILVFEHPHSGRQLPAGTVEDGEDPLDAVHREVWEETGLADCELLQDLGETIITLPAPYHALLADAIITTPDVHEMSPYPDIVTRGCQVRLLSVEGETAHCLYEIWRGSEPDDVLATVPCALPSDQITQHVRRFFYQLFPTDTTEERWKHTADGHTWELFWVPLERQIGLIPSQAQWLESYFDRLCL